MTRLTNKQLSTLTEPQLIALLLNDIVNRLDGEQPKAKAIKRAIRWLDETAEQLDDIQDAYINS